MDILLTITVSAYLVSVLSIFLYLKLGIRIYYFINNASLLLACTAIILHLVLRSIKVKFFNITNIFEVVLLMLLAVSVTLLCLRKKIKKIPRFFIILSAASLLAAIILLFPFISRTFAYPKPALLSPLISIHVTSAVAGEALLFITLCLHLSLYKTQQSFSSSIDRIYKILAGSGYLLFTLGALIAGPIWAKLSWGSFWSWDPKEISSLIVWMFFTVFMFLINAGRRYKMAALFLLVLTFAASLFTFIGVPFYLHSLHSH
jgi:ABC-type transport system involved in cytochrome c biogenesis permease subunit